MTAASLDAKLGFVTTNVDVRRHADLSIFEAGGQVPEVSAAFGRRQRPNRRSSRSSESRAGSPTGAQHISLKLRYQACSNEVCLPPVTLPVDATVNVANGAGSAHPAHPELFQTPR